MQRSAAEWALQWLWDQPEVSVVLSGMSTMTQVEQNLRSADSSRIHAYGLAEQELIARTRDMYRARTVIPCTKCNYCMPCPNGVNIPGNFDLFNYSICMAMWRCSFPLPDLSRRGQSCGLLRCLRRLRGIVSAENSHQRVDAESIGAPGLRNGISVPHCE